MRKLILFVLIFALVIGLTSFSYAGNEPNSKAASLIEAVSPTEVLIRATGISNWQKGDSKYKNYENYLLNAAENDARKSAVYFVLFGGSNPMLTQDSEKLAFSYISEEFFDIKTIKPFIAWESPELASRTKRTIKKKKKYELTIEKDFKINKEAVSQYLIAKKVIVSRKDLASEVGNPFIIVLPATEKGQNPIDLMRSNTNLEHAARVIESHLTAKQYDVIVPEQMVDLKELASAQQSLKDVEQDYSYMLALSIGSDVYITYDVSIANDKFGTQKATANVRAYETTTARLLGTETGYSPSAKTTATVLIENAVNDAIDKVLTRVQNYWKSDVEQGLQYKLIISLSTDFDEDQAEECSFAVGDALSGITKRGKYKENIVTKQTLDYLIWCDPNKYGQSSKVYRELKKVLRNEFSDGDLKQVNINRKMILLRIEAN